MAYLLLFFAAFLVLCLLAKAASDIFRFHWKRDSVMRRMTLNTTVALLPLLFLLLLTDAGFHLFYVRSDFFGFTYAASRWWDTYWKPENTLGYRDIEYTPENLSAKKLLFVLGDSIAAGQGIDQVSDRFSNKLEGYFGPEWKALTIARCGWSSSDELKALKLNLDKRKPEAVVLAYFFNDLEGAGQKAGIQKPNLIPLGENLWGGLVQHSALLNFIYWRLFRLTHTDLNDRYWDYLHRLANTPQVWEFHLQELREMASLTSAAGARFLVVIFPSMLTPESDLFITDRVKEALTREGIEVLDLHSAVSTLALHERVANSTDHHPGRAVHLLAAKELFRLLRSLDPRLHSSAAVF